MPTGRPKSENITARQAEIMQEIVRHKRIYGTLPTMQQIADRFGISAPSVYGIIKALVEKRYLEKGEDSPCRTYIIRKEVEPGWSVKTAVPLLGMIPCGPPTEPFTDYDGQNVMVDASLTRACSVFALRLDGTSMRNIGYEPGDVVIIRRQQLAENNDIVAAVVNGEATLKRLIYTPDRIALKAENPDFAPIEVGCGDEFRVIGKVVGHIKQKDIVYGRQ